ncbi:topoisomerase DNA-binding C4 zinc finger domain-containing protein [Vibrio sp. LQ2]
MQKPVIEAHPQLSPNLCPNCHFELVVRIAKKGQNTEQSFYGCTAFPKCRYTCDC